MSRKRKHGFRPFEKERSYNRVSGQQSGNPKCVPSSATDVYALCDMRGIIRPVTVYNSERAAEEHAFFLSNELNKTVFVVGCSVYRSGGSWVVQGPKSILFTGQISIR